MGSRTAHWYYRGRKSESRYSELILSSLVARTTHPRRSGHASSDQSDRKTDSGSVSAAGRADATSMAELYGDRAVRRDDRQRAGDGLCRPDNGATGPAERTRPAQ